MKLQTGRCGIQQIAVHPAITIQVLHQWTHDAEIIIPSLDLRNIDPGGFDQIDPIHHHDRMHIMRQAKNVPPVRPRTEGRGVDLIVYSLGVQPLGQVDEAHILQGTRKNLSDQRTLDLDQVTHRGVGIKSSHHATGDCGPHQGDLNGQVRMLFFPFLGNEPG